MRLTKHKKRKNNIIKLNLLSVGMAFGLMQMNATAAQNESRITDPAITTAVEQRLRADDGVASHRIDVITKERVVHLSGTVDNLLAKHRAVRLAQTIRGVGSVLDQIKVAGVEVEDSQLKKHVEEALLKDHAADAYELEVQVDKGVVTLSGEVDSWQEQQHAAAVVQSIRGVRQVQNETTFEPHSDRPDFEIQADIQSRLAADIWVRDGLISVAVREGHVDLTGVVGSAIEKRRAELDAWVQNTVDVNSSGLVVDPTVKDDVLRKNKLASERTDESVQQAIENTLLYDPRVYYFNPNVTVHDGTVTLTGEVETLEAKRAAEESAFNTVGVQHVRNFIKVRPVGTPGDDLVEQRVEAALKQDSVLISNEILVSCLNGRVFLSGLVDTYYERSRADRVAGNVKGVIEVENNIRVDDVIMFPGRYGMYSTTPYFHPTGAYGHVIPDVDHRIQQEIESELFWSPFIDEDDINVHVNEGVATLTGEVDSWLEFGAASDNAYQGGASDVINEIEVLDEKS